MGSPEISVVIPFHDEKEQWIRRCLLSVMEQKDAPTFEIVAIADSASSEVTKAVAEGIMVANNRHSVSGGSLVGGRLIESSHSDLGTARNTAIAESNGKYIALLDGDDLFGPEWLKQAYEYARKYRDSSVEVNKEDLVLHPEYMVMFGADNFIHKCHGDDDPQFDERDMIQWNLWSALAFASKDLFTRFPYKKAENGFGFEDHIFNCETLGAEVRHRCPPGSVHAIRLKRNSSSLASRSVEDSLVIPKMDLFERRDYGEVKKIEVSENTEIPQSVFRQTLYLHHQIGEYQLFIHPQMGVRIYPRQFVFEQQARLRDDIGSAKHVVLVNRIARGGAEKYAINWISALLGSGKDAVIVETGDSSGRNEWHDLCDKLGVRVIKWDRDPGWNEDQNLYALCRGLIQSELDSLFVCNSPEGWGLIHKNPAVLAKKVITASFAIIPHGIGFTNCPAFHLKKQPSRLFIITDNEEHAQKMRLHGGLNVSVIRPKCSFDGQSKKSTLVRNRKRVLWAGRGTQEKRPDLLPSLAAVMKETADIHVWGDVKPMNGPENLKYRGPFDKFEEIDGTYDCYLMTSYSEGMPNTACEAALSGLPVIGPDVGGIGEITDGTFKTFDPVTVSSMILRCDEYKTNPQKVRLWAEEFDASVNRLVDL